MTTYFAPIGHGLGDLIICIPAVQSLIASGEPTWLVLRSPRQEGCETLIPGLSGSIREIDLRPMELPAGARFINLRQHPLQTDHVWGSAEFEAKYPGYKIADIVGEICADLGIHADFHRLTPLPYEPLPVVQGKVCLIPGSGGVFKCWNRENWLEVASRLRNAGHEIVLLGQPDQSAAVRELVEHRLPLVETPTLKDALNAVSSALTVVSVDTGLMHLALQQCTPVAAMWINNPGSLNYLRTVRHCFPVVSPRCVPECVSEELDKNLNLVTEWKEWCGYESWECHAPPAVRCMNNITVEAVWAQTKAALQCANERARERVAR